LFKSPNLFRRDSSWHALEKKSGDIICCLHRHSIHIGVVASRKELKQQSMANIQTFIPLSFETSGMLKFKAHFFKLAKSPSHLQQSFLLQRMSLTVQRFNAVCYTVAALVSSAPTVT